MRDVIIIGGGIAGASTAYYLAADGLDVLLVEQLEPNAGASGANAGSLHAQIQHEPFVEKGLDWARRFAPALPFYAASIGLWQTVGDRLGCELEFKQTGGLLIARSDEQMRQIEAKCRIEQEAGIPSEILDRVTLMDLAPYISSRVVGGLLCPLEGKANPLVAVTSFLGAAAALGATVLTNTRVFGIVRDGSSFCVHTESGELRARTIVNAAGADAGRIASSLGCRFDIQAYPIQLSVTEPVIPLIHHLVYAASDPLTLKQAGPGTILIGGGWPARIDDKGRPQVSLESLTRNLSLALDTVPALEHVSVMRTWAAVVNGTDDWLPIIGEVPGVPGFFMNYVPWMGFTGGPAGARIVASLIQGHEPPFQFDVGAFRPGSRYSS